MAFPCLGHPFLLHCLFNSELVLEFEFYLLPETFLESSGDANLLHETTISQQRGIFIMHFAYNSINCHQEAVYIRSLSSSQTSLLVCLCSFPFFSFKLHCRASGTVSKVVYYMQVQCIRKTWVLILAPAFNSLEIFGKPLSLRASSLLLNHYLFSKHYQYHCLLKN